MLSNIEMVPPVVVFVVDLSTDMDRPCDGSTTGNSCLEDTTKLCSTEQPIWNLMNLQMKSAVSRQNHLWELHGGLDGDVLTFMSFRKFSVDDKDYTIEIRQFGPTISRMSQIAFYRIKDYKGPGNYTKITETTNDSSRQAFRVITEVVSWIVSWILKNRTFASAYVISIVPEKSRESIFEKYIQMKTSEHKFKYFKTSQRNDSGEERIFFVLYDPEYLENNSIYKERLNKTLNTMFKVNL